MPAGTRAAGKQPATMDPEGGNDDNTASPSEHQQIAIRAFSPEQESDLDRRFNDINATITASHANLTAIMAELATQVARLTERIDQQQTTSPILPSVETSPPAQPNPSQITLPHQVLKTQVLKPKDVGLFNPDVAEEHGLGPVATVSSETVYRDIYTWVERLKDLVHVHGSDDVVRQVIQPCLRGSAATWWIAELTDEDRKKLRNADLQRWYSLLIKRFKIQTSVAISRITSSSYSPQDLSRSPRIWIHQMLHYAKAAEMDSTFN